MNELLPPSAGAALASSSPRNCLLPRPPDIGRSEPSSRRRLGGPPDRNIVAAAPEHARAQQSARGSVGRASTLPDVNSVERPFNFDVGHARAPVDGWGLGFNLSGPDPGDRRRGGPTKPRRCARAIRRRRWRRMDRRRAKRRSSSRSSNSTNSAPRCCASSRSALLPRKARDEGRRQRRAAFHVVAGAVSGSVVEGQRRTFAAWSSDPANGAGPDYDPPAAPSSNRGPSGRLPGLAGNEVTP